MTTKLNSVALHKREYRFGALPNIGWRFLQAGERIEKGDYAYHVSDSTYIPCKASVGRIVDKSDGGNTYIRIVDSDNIREEELLDLKAQYAKADRTAFTPGPWNVESGWTIVAKPLRPEAPYIVADVHNCFIAPYRAPFHYAPETTKANAQLISAAPDLLIQLQRLVAMAEKMPALSEWDFRDARAAIAKAEGQA